MNWRRTSGDSQSDYLSMLRAVLREWYSKPREGWHVTDVIMCPRQRVFRLIDPAPPSPTDRDINMYTSGKSIHEALQKLFMSNRTRFEIEKYVEFEGIQGSVDIYDKKKNQPIEFKSLRAQSIPEPKSFHIEQLMYYMAMLDAPVGQIIYQCLLQYGSNPFVMFEITMTEQDRREQLNKLVQETKLLQMAISAKDPGLARGVFSNGGMNWLCRDCPYSNNCERIQSVTSSA